MSLLLNCSFLSGIFFLIGFYSRRSELQHLVYRPFVNSISAMKRKHGLVIVLETQEQQAELQYFIETPSFPVSVLRQGKTNVTNGADTPRSSK